MASIGLILSPQSKDAGIRQRFLNALGIEKETEKGLLSDGDVTLFAAYRSEASSDCHLYENDHCIIAFDGELYNSGLIAQNKNRGKPEAEARLVADLYTKHGLDWWSVVRGVYAVLIWDKQRKKAFGFTDRIGVRPLVYWTGSNNSESSSGNSPGIKAAASHGKALWTLPGFEKKLNPQSVFLYLNMEMIPSPHCIYQGLRRLESGHFVELSSEAFKEQEYWKLNFLKNKESDISTIKERCVTLCEQAVSDLSTYRVDAKELGGFLSGGTDSSTVTGLVHQLHPGTARSFSIGFDESGYDEMEYARIAAKAYNSEHHEYYVTPDDILNMLPKMVAAYDEPFANSSAIPTYFCAKMAGEYGVKVMLGGDGGDEIFGGNSRYHDTFTKLNRFPTWFTDGLVGPALKLIPDALKVSVLKKAESYINRANAPLYEKIHAFSLPYYMDYQDIFAPEFLAQGPFASPSSISKRYIEASGTSDPVEQYLFNDMKITLMDNDLRKVNRMVSMAGLSVRYPFLDTDLVEYTARIPSSLKVKDGQLRWIFKEAFKGLLPEEIIAKKKHGFGLPVVRWMLRPGKLNDLLQSVLFDPALEQRGIFKKGFVRKLYDRAQQDTTPFYGTYLYYILVLELWLRGV